MEKDPTNSSTQLNQKSSLSDNHSSSSKIIEQNRKFAAVLSLLAAILLFYFGVSGLLNRQLFLPLGFILMGLHFLYSYASKYFGFDFGRITAPVRLLLLLGALVCLIIGLVNQN